MLSHIGWRRALIGAVLTLGALTAHSALAEPITLAQALERTATQSLTTVASQEAVKAAEARARQAALRPNPEVSLEVENVLGSGSMRGLESAEATLAVGQNFERGGKREARQAAAAAQVRSTQLSLTQTAADLALETRLRFAAAVAAEERLALARERAARAADLARIAETLVDVGREPPLRALRARSEADEAKAEVEAAQVAMLAARRALSGLWGEPTETIEAISTDILVRTVPPIEPNDSIDVALARAEADALRAIVARERAAGVSDFTVEAGIRRFQDTGDQAFVVGFSAPLGVRNRNQGEVAAAQAEVAAAEARVRLALNEAARRAQDAEAALRGADARLNVLSTRTEPQALEALRLAREGYEAGKFSLLDVLDAQDALSNARLNLIEARLDRANAIAALDRAAAR